MRILFSGCWDKKYCGDHTISIIDSISRNEILRQHTYVVHGAEKHCSFFIERGLKYLNVNWVRDYTDLLNEVDVQLFPIAIGTGTKGKVLSALAAGLTCVGSQEAFANVRANLEWPHAIYQSPCEVSSILLELSRLPIDALKSRSNATLFANHNPKNIAIQFWSEFLDD